METEQINKFKKEFKALVYQQGLLTESNARLKQLHWYDKSESHQKAILKELETKDNIKATIKEMQKGIDYEEWKKKSKRLTVLQYKLKSIDSKKQNIETEFLNFRAND